MDEDDQPVEAAFTVEPEIPKATGKPATLDSLEDLLFQLHIDFHLKEAEAKAKLKELKFNGLPRDAEARRQRLAEMYQAVKAAMASEGPPAQEEFDF